ncbi:hypothetical protein XENORESO_008116 [Xenotaenia resolanae]|uniref:Uncharacterized protein n=1 Tax=Xenotaenia resolanae TaxID=208358 RepID=A0ABV0VSC6_9TELE
MGSLLCWAGNDARRDSGDVGGVRRRKVRIRVSESVVQGTVGEQAGRWKWLDTAENSQGIVCLVQLLSSEGGWTGSGNRAANWTWRLQQGAGLDRLLQTRIRDSKTFSTNTVSQRLELPLCGTIR